MIIYMDNIDTVEFHETYEIIKETDAGTIEGIASFDETGCLGVDITLDGEAYGELLLEGGELYLTDLSGNKQKLSEF